MTVPQMLSSVQPVDDAAPATEPGTSGQLWLTFVTGLLLLLLCSLAGIIWTVADGDAATSPEVLLPIFSSTLTGLLGLFVRSPIR